jgi:Uncharacterized conserved protein
MIRIVKMTFKAEHIQDFLLTFEQCKHLIRRTPGCNYLALWRDKQNSNIVYTYSEWNHESDLENYRLSDLFKDTWQTVKPWFDKKPIAFSADKITEIL